MINSDRATGEVNRQEDAEVSAILRSGARGAAVLAGLATAIVVAIWFAFYLLVFVPRAITP
jgi:hypothetical protein